MALAAVAPADEPGSDPNVIKLEKPIDTHKGKVYQLKFGPLTAGIIIRNKKNPFQRVHRDDKSSTLEIDYELAAKYICDLTGVDEISLGQLSQNDFGMATARLFDLLMLGKN